MNFTISENAAENLKKEALLSFPNETCGILAGRKENNFISKIVPLINGEKCDSRYNFEANPLEFYIFEKQLKKLNLEIIGFYHSHPQSRAVPSKKDEKFMIPNLLYAIISVQKNKKTDLKVYEKTERFETK